MNKETLQEYLESLHTSGSAKSYLYSIIKFIETNPDCEKYGYQDIVDYMFELSKRDLKGTYKSKVLASIKKYYDYLMHIGVRDNHPCRRLSIKDNRRKGMNYEDLFTSDELELLLNREERYRYLGHRNKLIISMLIYQGLSSFEIERMNIQDIDVEAATIRIKASRKLNGRTLSMHPRQVTMALRYLGDSRPFLLRKELPTNRLIITKLGKSETVDGIHAMIEPLKVMFPEKKLHPKSIRASVISNWLNDRNIDLEDVQLMAGHKWPSSTERYRRADMDQQRRLINEFHPLND